MLIKLIDKSKIQISVDSKLYSSEVLHKCFYWYGNMFSVEIKLEEEFFIITLMDLQKEGDIEKMVDKIKNDLIDFKTREIISNETQNIREMLIAKAFAYGDEFEEIPPLIQDDGLGLDPPLNKF